MASSALREQWSIDLRLAAPVSSPKRHIVVTFDGTIHSQTTLDWVLANVARGGDAIFLVTVETGSRAWKDFFRDFGKEKRQREAEARQAVVSRFDRIKALAMEILGKHEAAPGDTAGDIEVHHVVIDAARRSSSGFQATTTDNSAILQLARELEADILVVCVGSSQKSSSSITAAVPQQFNFQAAPCPVFVVGNGVQFYPQHRGETNSHEGAPEPSTASEATDMSTAEMRHVSDASSLEAGGSSKGESSHVKTAIKIIEKQLETLKASTLSTSREGSHGVPPTSLSRDDDASARAA